MIISLSKTFAPLNPQRLNQKPLLKFSRPHYEEPQREIYGSDFTDEKHRAWNISKLVVDYEQHIADGGTKTLPKHFIDKLCTRLKFDKSKQFAFIQLVLNACLEKLEIEKDNLTEKYSGQKNKNIEIVLGQKSEIIDFLKKVLDPTDPKPEELKSKSNPAKSEKRIKISNNSDEVVSRVEYSLRSRSNKKMVQQSPQNFGSTSGHSSSEDLSQSDNLTHSSEGNPFEMTLKKLQLDDGSTYISATPSSSISTTVEKSPLGRGEERVLRKRTMGKRDKLSFKHSELSFSKRPPKKIRTTTKTPLKSTPPSPTSSKDDEMGDCIEVYCSPRPTRSPTSTPPATPPETRGVRTRSMGMPVKRQSTIFVVVPPLSDTNWSRSGPRR